MEVVNNAKKYFIYFDCFVYFANVTRPPQSRRRKRLWKLFGNPWLFFALRAENAGGRLFFSGAVSAFSYSHRKSAEPVRGHFSAAYLLAGLIRT